MLELTGLNVAQRRRTRTYDVGNLETLIDYLGRHLVPVGMIISKLTTVTPGPEWVLLDGSALSKADYPELYAEIGATFGETATTFNLPDLADTYLTGVGAVAAGGAAGANTLNLAINQLPAHDHGITDLGHTHTFTGAPHNHTITDPGHAHTAQAAGTATAGAAAVGSVAGNTGSATTGITVDNATAGGANSTDATGVTVNPTGAGADIDNRPKSIGVYYFIKARS